MTVTELAFATSGTTGTPVWWVRSAAQISAETVLLADVCAAYQVDGIASYPPQHHLYGYLTGCALPEFLGVPCRPVALTDAPAAVLTGWRRPLVAAVPAALAQLARSITALARLNELVLVYSSAVLPPVARQLLAALGGNARLVELFGATETGLIGWRTDPSNPRLTLAADVSFAGPARPGSTGPLRIRSPRIGHLPGLEPPAEFGLDDVVTITDERGFRWLGRRSQIVKVNGRRVNLDEVVAVLRDAVPGITISCAKHGDDLRGEWFSVLAHTREAAVLNALRRACRSLPSWQRPRAVGMADMTVDTSAEEPTCT